MDRALVLMNSTGIQGLCYNYQEVDVVWKWVKYGSNKILKLSNVPRTNQAEISKGNAKSTVGAKIANYLNE